MSFFRNKQTRKQNIGEEKTNKCLKTIKDNWEPFKAIQKNDPAKLNYKSEWIKFTVKN